MSDSKDRRHFWRAHFRGEVGLKQAGQILHCQLDDISLKGALVDLETAAPLAQGDKAELLLELASGTAIAMQVTIVHIDGKQVGLRCDSIDVDSMTHLRRVIELNAGDAQVFERDLSTLLRDHRANR